MVIGVAAALALIAVTAEIGCSGDENNGEETGGPCDWIDCGGHGNCYEGADNYICDCEQGYSFQYGTCLPDQENSKDAYTLDSSDTSGYINPSTICNENDGKGGCLTDTQAVFCVPVKPSGYRSKTVNCKDGQHCEMHDDGVKCVTDPEYIDPICGKNLIARCEITDEHDFIEDEDLKGYDYKSGTFTDTTYWWLVDKYLCGEDDAVVLSGMYLCGGPHYECETEPYNAGSWASLTMTLDPPPDGSYYGLDIKYDKFYYGNAYSVCYEHQFPPYDSQILSIQFGDEQRQDVDITSLASECIYKDIATFTTAGIVDNTVRLQFQNASADCGGNHGWENISKNYIALAKVRIWSCKCESLGTVN